MFNIHKFERQKEVKEKIERLKDDYLKERKMRHGEYESLFLISIQMSIFLFLLKFEKTIELNNELAGSYKKKIENFLINVWENIFQYILIKSNNLNIHFFNLDVREACYFNKL